MTRTFCCSKCNFRNPSGHLLPSCGMGTTWNLLKCPSCNQLFAYPYTDGFVPDEVLRDSEVEIVEAREILLPTH